MSVTITLSTKAIGRLHLIASREQARLEERLHNIRRHGDWTGRRGRMERRYAINRARLEEAAALAADLESAMWEDA